METTIDRFGRVVIPKRIRDELGLDVGDSLLIEQQGEGIVLKPAREGAPVKRKGRVLVFAGEAREDPGDVVRKARDERMRKLVGQGRR
jgi:AbrB family looped-hinge helix DNA binding protein